MFQVHVHHPLDDVWEDRDVRLKELAGKHWDFGWADRFTRFLCWQQPSLALAKSLQSVLASVAGTVVTVREQ